MNELNNLMIYYMNELVIVIERKYIYE